MSKLLSNLNVLRNKMKEEGWYITAFPFKFNQHEYIVLFEDFDNSNYDSEDKYYTVILTFIDSLDSKYRFETLANAGGFKASISDIRKFFHIKYTKNLGDFLSQFYSNFDSHIPLSIPDVSSNSKVRKHIIDKINKNETDNSFYCYDVRRNGKTKGTQNYRTIYNDNKTRILRLNLYEVLKANKDKTISFYYSPNPSDELTDEEILKKFSERESKVF